MSKIFKVHNKQLCEWIFSNADRSISKEVAIMNQISKLYELSDIELKQISAKLKKSFVPHFNKRMKACRYSRLIFERDGQIFLKNFFLVKFSK